MKLYLLNRASKRPQRPSDLLGLREPEYTDAERLDFDFSIELFDIWFEARQAETVEVPAKKQRKGYTQEPKYKTLNAQLGIESAERAAGFAEVGSDADRLSDLVAAGDISVEELPGLLAEHGSAEAVLRAILQ
jgi:hypothetical protein